MDVTKHQLTAIDLGDAPEAWAAAGFTVVGGTVQLGNTLVRTTGSGGRFEGWAIDGVATPIDGLATAVGFRGDAVSAASGEIPDWRGQGLAGSGGEAAK